MSNIAKPNNKASRNREVAALNLFGNSRAAQEAAAAEVAQAMVPRAAAPAAPTSPATAVSGSRNFLFNNAPKSASAGPLFTGSLNTTEEAEKARAEIRQRANAAYAQSAVKAPFVGQPAPNVLGNIPTPANNAYNKAKRLANSRKSCSPCEEVILEKLDTLLDRSNPSTGVSNALTSGKKTVQTALDAVVLGLGEAGAAGKFGLGVAGAAVLASAIRLGQAAAAGARKVGGAAADAVVAAGSELEAAARTARKCIKGSPTGDNRSVRCAAAYAAVKEATNKLKSLMPSLPVMPWPVTLTFPKISYFTLKNANGMTKFNRNVSSARGVLGRFGNRVTKRFGNFSKSVRNVSGRATGAISRGTLSTRNYLSGRTKQRQSILRFIKRSYYNRGVKNIAPAALERWTRELVATGMSADDARIAIKNVLGGLNMGDNGMVTATNVGPTAKSLGVAGAPELIASTPNNPGLQALLAPPQAGLTAPRGLNALAAARQASLAQATTGGRSRKNRSRKNRKASRKNRKNRKGSRKH